MSAVGMRHDHRGGIRSDHASRTPNHWFIKKPSVSRDSRVLPPSIYTSLHGKESGDGKGIKAGVFRG